MKQELTTQQVRQSNNINRYAYIAFLLLAGYFVVTNDKESAIVNLGIAMIFDPFDAKVKWQNRPLFQRLWTLLHVGAVTAGAVFMIIEKSSF